MMAGEDKMQKIYEREGRNTSSNDPKLMNSRVFLGNFPAEGMTRKEVEDVFSEFGKVLGISLHKTYGFVQFDNEDNAKAAVKEWNGKTLKGLKLDVNIATERRKEPSDAKRPRPSDEGYHSRGRVSRFDQDRDDDFEYDDRERRSERSRWGPPRRSPSPGRIEYEMRMRHMEMDRRGGPRFRVGPDPYFEPMRRPMRDPYFRPRDDPYDRDRFHDERFSRDFPPRPGPFPREPMRAREPMMDPDYDRPRDLHRSLPSPIEEKREPPSPRRIPPAFRNEVKAENAMEMQIIVVNKRQKEYANHVRSRFNGLSLNVQLLHLSPTVSLADALDEAAESGLLYAVIISNQNEMHRSVTLTILHGRNPQEHKNMPLDDALGLVDRDFERYCIDVREGRVTVNQHRPTKNDVSALLGKVAAGGQLRPDQIDAVINTLQKQKEGGVGGGSGGSGGLGRFAPQSSGVDRRPEVPSASKESIQNQQADLQAKILSLLGSSAVVPSGSSSQNQPPMRDYSQRPARGQGEYSQMSGGQYGSYGASGSRW